MMAILVGGKFVTYLDLVTFLAGVRIVLTPFISLASQLSTVQIVDKVT